MTKHTKKQTRFDLSGDMEKIRDAFADTAKDMRGKATEVFTHSIEDVRDKSADIKGNMEAYITEKPFKSLLLAMLSGICIGGALVRRKKLIILRHRE
jgi:ElaB/YqjD/DUF883 family membrane-anchored ribosome-binding protein